MGKKILVFDYDGTIVDSYKLYAKRFAEVAGEYLPEGKRIDFRSLYDKNFATSLSKHQMTKRDILAFIRAIRAPFTGKPELIVPFTGMVSLLNELTRRYTVYIVTSNLTSVIKESLAYWGIKGVRKVVGGDVSFSKVEKLRKIARAHRGSEFFYIGDTIGDITEAREAGYVSVAVSWGYHSRRQLERAKPDILLSKQHDLQKLFA